MKIKLDELKNFIKNIIRESLIEKEYKDILSEVSPPGAKSERMIQHVKSSLRNQHPNWSEDKVTSVAIATAWKNYDKGSLDEEDEMDESAPPGFGPGKKYADIYHKLLKQYTNHPQHAYATMWKIYDKMSEQVGANVVAEGTKKETNKKEVNKFARKAFKNAHGQLHHALKIPMSKSISTSRINSQLEKLHNKRQKNGKLTKRDLHLFHMLKAVKNVRKESYDPASKNMDEVGWIDETGEMDEASYKVVSPHQYRCSRCNHALQVQNDPEMTQEENYKVQHRSYMTSNDTAYDPKNVRDPEVPMT